MIYLDYNATTPIDKLVLEKMTPYLKDFYSNPSSVYRFAQESKRAIENARFYVADLISADPEEVIFTSGGTEADNFAIKGRAFFYQDKGNHIITSKIEHHAVLKSCEFLKKIGFEITYLDVDKYGIIDLNQLEESIRNDTVLVSIMYANNEVGSIQPIKNISKICNKNGIIFHTDAVQALGKIDISVKDLNVDLLSISSHKIYGPKGVGALYVKKGVKLIPLHHGGGQERNMRAGTENVPGIVGFGEACRISKEELKEQEKKIRLLRDKLEEGIKQKIPDIKVNGHHDKRLYNTLNICFKYIEGESILINLDFEGICTSSGSACTSGSLEPSHVLLSMGIPHELSHGSLRFSLGKFNTMRDIDRVLEVLPLIIEKLRKISPFWQKKYG
ncbi:MAG: cysteine desulfurase NifS [Candidatus Omnitrophica bacterium]|nr:cysteine desulfurase NifS [Candidatus Omnitrophota bacterium]